MVGLQRRVQLRSLIDTKKLLRQVDIARRHEDEPVSAGFQVTHRSAYMSGLPRNVDHDIPVAIANRVEGAVIVSIRIHQVSTIRHCRASR